MKGAFASASLVFHDSYFGSLQDFSKDARALAIRSVNLFIEMLSWGTDEN